MTIKNITKIFLFLYLMVLLMGLGYAAIAQTPTQRPLEIDYPEFPGIEAPEGHPVFLPNYIRYLYQVFVIIGGLVAFVACLMGGFRYLTSAGNPAQMADAREQILTGILGLIIILSSYVVLHELNPDLVSLQPPHVGGTEEEGIVIYTDANCGNGSNGKPGVFFPLPPNTQYIKIKGTQAINSFDIFSFWVSRGASNIIRIAFFRNSDCSGDPEPNHVFSPGQGNACIPTGGLTNIQCVELRWHVPGVWLFSYENGDPENPDPNRGTFATFRQDQSFLKKGLKENVRSVAFVPDEKRQINFGVILHDDTGARSEKKGWAHLYLPNNTGITRLNVDNPRASSITVLQIDPAAPSLAVKICENIDCECQPDARGECQDASITYEWDGLQTIPGLSGDIARAIVLSESRDRWWNASDAHHVAICQDVWAINVIGHITWRTGGCFRGVSAIDLEEGSKYIAILYNTDSEPRIDPRGLAQAIVINGDVRNLNEYKFNELTGIIYIIKVYR